MNLNIGDIVKRVGGNHNDFCVGDTGQIVNIRDGGKNIDVRVEVDSNFVSYGNHPDKLQAINQANKVITPNLFMKTFLDADTLALVKAGWIDGNLLPTSEGRNALEHILFTENKAELVDLAKAKIAEAEKVKN